LGPCPFPPLLPILESEEARADRECQSKAPQIRGGNGMNKMYSMVDADIWSGSEGMMMTPQDKYFYIYLLTNPNINHIGIYQISKKQMAFDLSYSIETVHSLMERFTLHHQLIRYNPELREIAIQNWWKHNLYEDSKRFLGCLYSE
jgi:hypothetical protein